MEALGIPTAELSATDKAMEAAKMLSIAIPDAISNPAAGWNLAVSCVPSFEEKVLKTGLLQAEVPVAWPCFLRGVSADGSG